MGYHEKTVHLLEDRGKCSKMMMFTHQFGKRATMRKYGVTRYQLENAMKFYRLGGGTGDRRLHSEE
ncbi:MAG: hypothetical protein V2A56_05915 [bacterium]